MTIVSIIIIVIILAMVIIYVTLPLFTSQDEVIDISTVTNSERLATAYNSVLDQIRELDFDYNLGKLTPEEHNAQREEYLSRAAELRRQMQMEETAQTSKAA